MKIRIMQPTSLALSPQDTLRRNETRPIEHQDPSYSEKYDDRTLFYDAIPSGQTLLLPGPPLLNLERLITTEAFTLNGHHPVELKTQQLERTQMTQLIFENTVTSGSSLELQHPQIRPIKTQVQNSDIDELRDAKVLVTMQKDEELSWIQDWITYYSKVHSCNTVLIFDNNSTKYSIQELADAIEANGAIESAILIKWPFKYGPQGGTWVGTQANWDSDFCQIGAFQSARFRLLQNVRGMINADIDELLVPLTGRTIFEELDRSPKGMVGYSGHWIENVPTSPTLGTPPRHYNYSLTAGRDATCSMKWSGTPSRWPAEAQPTAHYVRNIEYLPSPDFYIAHFRALNSGWKTKSRLKEASSMPNFKLDVNLIKSLNLAFPHSGVNNAIVDVDADRTEDGHVYRFQHWIRSKIDQLTASTIPWNKKWLWKNTIPVFEGYANIGQVAFDCHISENEVELSVSVRNKQNLPELEICLNRVSGELDCLGLKRLGYWTTKAGYNETLDETWDNAAKHLSSQMSIIWNELNRPEASNSENFTQLPSAKLLRHPLRNLRGSDQYSSLADRISDFSEGRKLLYVPNQGNWGDALIHKGILQFLKFYEIDYQMASRSEVQSLARSMTRFGTKIDDLVLASGGGGSWRNAKSGNYRFVEEVSPIFEKVLVFPHTYEAGQIGDTETDLMYIARDSTLSRAAIPESFSCHDMAFFLQLPFLLEVPQRGLTGVFMRNDTEKHVFAKSLNEGYDLSSMGNHLSPITPFFQVLSIYSHIVTDRMHVAIASAMLGCSVDLYPGNYGKSNAVYAHTLMQFYPTVTLRRW